MSARLLKGIHKSIDVQIEQACDLEVQHALALYRSGKGKLYDADEVIAEARCRIG